MGLMDRWKKKKERPHTEEVSPGGSNIYRYEEPEEEGWRPPQEYGRFAEEITAHFEQLFPDRESFVFHELISDLVHIDVNIMRPKKRKRLLCGVYNGNERSAHDASGGN